MKTDNKSVMVYDFDTRQTKSIPAAELTPNMMFARVEGGGEVWVNVEQFSMGAPTVSDFKHPPFDQETRNLIDQKIRRPLKKMIPKKLAAWENLFRCVPNPQHQIHRWVQLVSAFTRFSAVEKLNLQQKRECLLVMFRATNSPKDLVLNVVSLQALTQDQAQRAIDALSQEEGEINPVKGGLNLKGPHLQDICVGNPRGIKSVDEFKTTVADADVIFAVDENGYTQGIMFGKAKLEEIIASGKTEDVNVVALPLDVSNSSELELLTSAIRAIKGSCDWFPFK